MVVTSQFEVVVCDVRDESDSVKSLLLSAPDGKDLPTWEPGAHVDLFLPSGLIRKYSLCGDPQDRRYYRIAVLADPQGRGGSVELHQISAPGLSIAIAGPRNRFSLVGADHYLFIAGGIGITPILPMVREAQRLGRSWSLVYGGRSRTSMAFLDEVESWGPERVTVFTEDVDGVIDLHRIISEQPAATTLYCCGPPGLLNAVREVAADHSQISEVHFEKFTGSDDDRHAATEGDTEFIVECARAGKSVVVPVGRSILDVVLEKVDSNYAYDCSDGYCGTCETKVLGGRPDHRDDILDETERAAQDVMMICVGRSLTERLVLDI